MQNMANGPQKRVLAIHDISCVGKCSLTVALPIISAAGLEVPSLPTAVLSTHTGGFTGFTYRDLTEDMIPILEHYSVPKRDEMTQFIDLQDMMTINEDALRRNWEQSMYYTDKDE